MECPAEFLALLTVLIFTSSQKTTNEEHAHELISYPTQSCSSLFNLKTSTQTTQPLTLKLLGT